jgi:hypothetical protein
VVNENLAGTGQFQALASALEQGCPQFLLELTDRAADRRGDDIQGLSGTADRAELYDGLKIVKSR